MFMYVYYVFMCAVQFTFDVTDIKLNMGCQLMYCQYVTSLVAMYDVLSG